ncbi:MAG: hypothetical protein ACFFHV_16975 [Promethearchaeota archaeon]
MTKKNDVMEHNPSNNKIEKLIEKEKRSYVQNVKNEILKEGEFSPEVKEVLDDAFTEIIEDNTEEKTENLSINSLKNNKKGVKLHFDERVNNISEKSEVIAESDDKDLETIYQKKLSELEEKIENYNIRYQKLEETIQEYEDRDKKLVEKRKEFEVSINEFRQKTKAVEKSKEEFKDKSEKLREAREHFLKLTRQVEEKKNDLEKRDKELKKLQWILEKNKYDLEKDKIDLEREKLEFELLRSDLERKVKEGDLKNYNEFTKDKVSVIEGDKKLRGKAEFLRDLLEELTNDGIFQASFLIDDKGMIVSEHSNKLYDAMAIGAMFSLICTNAIRTVNSLNLQELGYFKLSSTKGEFMAKNINLSNYERTLILLAYYDEDSLVNTKRGQKLSKKTINKIMKSIKEDFYEFGQGKEISWVFENLTNRINFLKKKYVSVNKNIEQKRLDSLNKTSIGIKEIFES